MKERRKSKGKAVVFLAVYAMLLALTQSALAAPATETVEKSVMIGGTVGDGVIKYLPNIIDHPKSMTVVVGDDAVFTVYGNTASTVMYYRWQYKAPGSTTWKDSTQTGADTDTLVVKTTVNHNGYQYRCVLKDGGGYSKESNAATLTVLPKITAQPSNKTVEVGDSAEFKITATGKATLKYQWQCKAPGSTTWTNSTQSGATTAKLTVSTNVNHNGYKYRCKVTDGNNKVNYSKDATLTIKPKISTQPVTKTVNAGENAVFTVAANGKATLKYQWQCQAPGSTTWTDSTQTGARTTQLTIATNINHNGYKYRCKVTDGNGKINYSKEATLKIKLKIDLQPLNRKVRAGCTARFTVTPNLKGDTLTYQWECKGPSDTNWSNSTQPGAKTDTLKVASTTSHNGYQYRCVVKDKYGQTVTTSAVKLTIWNGKIDSSVFPDTNFRTYISQTIDKSHDGFLSAAEIKDVTILDVKNMQIGNLTGVELFTELKELICSNNNLTKLDVSGNSELQRLYCSANTGLGNLDVSRLRELVELNCMACDLSALDVSRNLKLEYLDCTVNNLTEIDVTKNTKLEYFCCGLNQLTSINLTKNVLLEEFYCEYNQISKLDLSKNTKLRNIICSANQIRNIDLSNNTALLYIALDYGVTLTGVSSIVQVVRQ